MIQTVPLADEHQKKLFTCGKPMLDQYLHTQAKQDVKRKLAACFVLPAEDLTIQGYYTLSNASVSRNDLPGAIIKKLPPAYHDLPATLMGRLAVGTAHQGQGLGKLLLVDALWRAFGNTETIASMAIIVDPLDQQAVQFYLKYGFIALPTSGKMFISMGTVAQLFV